MGTVVTIPFDITGWEPEPLDLGAAASAEFGRATVRKSFGGPLTGTSVASLTTVTIGGAPAGYVAVELVTGTLDGRSGSFVLQHTGTIDGADARSAGEVLTATASGGLAGLRGTATFAHDESGATVTLDYELPGC